MRKTIAFVTTIILIIVLAACGGNANNVASNDSNATDGSGEKIELTMMNRFLRTSTDGAVIARIEMLEEFKRKHPNVVISEESLQDPTYKTKIKTLAAGNDLPDVFELLGSDAQMFVDNGLVKPLDEVMEQDPEFKNVFIPSTLDDFTVNGQLVGIPMQMISSSLIYYNEAIFKEVGIDQFPETWDEFLAAIEILRENGYTPISLGNKGNWLAQSSILSALADRFTGTEWFYSLKNNEGAKFTDEPFVAALRAMQQLSEVGAFNTDLNSIDNGQQRTAYYNGEAAMFIEGSWAISSVTTDAPQEILENTRLAVFPAVDGGAGNPKATSGGAAWAFAINANLEGEKLEAAIALVKQLTGVEYAKRAIENNADSASIPENYDSSKVSPLFMEYTELLNELEITPIYDAHLSPAVIDAINRGLQNLLIGMVTPEQLAQDFQNVLDQ